MHLLIYVLFLKKRIAVFEKRYCKCYERNSVAMMRNGVRDTKEISLADLRTSQGLLHNATRNSKYSLNF